MSKGAKPRPLSVSYKQYSDNYDAIFGKKDETDENVLVVNFVDLPNLKCERPRRNEDLLDSNTRTNPFYV